MTELGPTGDGRTITIRIHISVRKWGGLKLSLATDDKIDAGTARAQFPINARERILSRLSRYYGPVTAITQGTSPNALSARYQADRGQSSTPYLAKSVFMQSPSP